VCYTAERFCTRELDHVVLATAVRLPGEWWHASGLGQVSDGARFHVCRENSWAV
jgi:hypothetical protein